MNKIYPVLLILAILFIVSCNKNEDPGLAGLVTFAEEPVFINGEVKFEISIQFSLVGQAVNCEYTLSDGTTLVNEGQISCSSNTDGLGIFWNSPQVTIPVNQTQYSGKTLTVKLDPANKVTLPEYTNETYVNLYKVANVVIP